MTQTIQLNQPVLITWGTYKGQTATVTATRYTKNVIVKLDSTKQEIELSTDHIETIQATEQPANNLTAIDTFIEQWKREATEFYNHIRNEYLKLGETEQYAETAKKQGKTKRYIAHMEQSHFLSNYNKQTSQLMNYYADSEYFADRVESIVNEEGETKKEYFLKRITDKAGNILNVESLEVGVNGEINGIVKGDKATVKVKSALAGGHTVQCLHFRVLVKVIAE